MWFDQHTKQKPKSREIPEIFWTIPGSKIRVNPVPENPGIPGFGQIPSRKIPGLKILIPLWPACNWILCLVHIQCFWLKTQTLHHPPPSATSWGPQFLGKDSKYSCQVEQWLPYLQIYVFIFVTLSDRGVCRVAELNQHQRICSPLSLYLSVTPPGTVCDMCAQWSWEFWGGLDESISASIRLNLCVFRDRLGIEVGYKAAEPTARLYLHFPSLQSRARAQSPLNGTRDRLCWENASQNTLVPNCHLLAWRNVKIPSEEIRREA